MSAEPALHDDPQTLRRCVRELAALSTLSAVWVNSDLQQIADGLCAVVLRAVPLALAHVRLRDADGQAMVETARTPDGPLAADDSRAFGDALDTIGTAGVGEARMPHPNGSGDLQLLILPLGCGGDCGHLVAAAKDLPFPTETDRLMLSVAANQAAIVLQQKRSELQVRRSEQELADFFDNATIGLHWVDSRGTILRANPAELSLLGYSAEDYIGHHIAEFHVDRDVIDDLLRKLWNGEQVRNFEARLRCQDGSIKDVLIDSNVLWEDGRFVHTRCFTRDITEQKGRQESLRTQTDRLGLLWEAASVLLSAEEPDQMLRGVFAKIGPHLGVDAYFNYMLDPDGGGLTLSSSGGITEDVARQIARLEFNQAICGTVAHKQRPLIAVDIQHSDDAKVQLVKSMGVRAYACHPLLIDDRLIGTLSFASRTRDSFDADELAFIETIAHYVTVACERLRLLQALRESDRRKDEFLATLAHELRNPLAPIRSAVKVLQLRGADNADARWGREVIERQVNHLTRLIDDLLEISRITRNDFELRERCVELSEIIGGAVEASRPLIEASGHELIVSLPAEPVYLDGDLVRLAQVFLNILNNAAKYTDRGGRIWLTAERDGDTLVVRVRDTGVGIPPDQLPRLFEMFYQVDRSLERTHGGLGIGLSLVRRLVEFHGGTVQAYSEGIGRGSEFVVKLPVRTREPEPRPAPREEIVRQGSSRILVADDNRDSAESLSMFLRLQGNEVVTAYDGVEAIAAAERFQPDAVLLDIGMPGMNGEEACRRIRDAEWGRAMMLVALTGWGQDEDRRRTMQAGFDAHLVKPVDPVEVMTLLASRRSTASAAAAPPPTASICRPPQ